jgi:hypothetical protein
MNVMFVNVSTDNKSVFAFCQRHSEVIADLVRQLRRDFPGLKRLPQVVGDHIIIFALPASNNGVLPLGKKKLLVGDRRVTLIGRDQIAAVGFLWIFHIICYPAQGLRHGPAFAAVERHQACCCHFQNLP